jgi:excinuclease UvrABC nuclease subunit
MPIAKKWSRYTKDNIRTIPGVYGAYELSDGSKHVVYIGEGNLQDRLLAHFAASSDPTPGISYFRYVTTGSKQRAVQRQNALLSEFMKKHGRLPRYNQKRYG